jgi:hypothetical protein
MWAAEDTPNGLMEMLMCGRNSRDQTEVRDRWEYIRRFMENGPQSVPRVKLIGKIPWPWRSVWTTLSGTWPIFSFKELNWTAPFIVLMLPAGLLYAFFQWLSLLLCWEPVFPRAIRKACGDSFLDVIEAILIDLIAWSMLGGLIWYYWTAISPLIVFS